MWPQRACTIAIFGSTKNGTVRLQEVGGRDEVGVEDGDELALGDLHARLERARLVAGAIGAMEIGDVDALRRVAAHGRSATLRVSSVESSRTWISSSSRG